MADIGVIPTFPDLKGKRVLVTGGSAGIGKATALAFNASGAIVAVLGRRKERLDAVVGQMKHGVSIVADLTKSEDLPRAVQETIDKLGGLDILVNNGGPSTEAMQSTGEAGYLAAFQLHVTSTLTLLRAAEEELIKNKGAVVNVSSVIANVPVRGNLVNYGVAKAAQDALTRNLAFEFAPKGVRINSVLPAATDTEATQRVAAKMGATNEDLLARAGKLHALGRGAVPNEVAAPIVFLSSNAASFITGVNMPVDGGVQLGFWFNREPF